MIKKGPQFFPSLNSKLIVAYFMFFSSEALQQVEGTKINKIKVVPSIFMKFWSRNNLE